MKRILFLSILCMAAFNLSAQDIPRKDMLLFNKQRIGGIQLATNGYGFNGTFGKYKGAYQLRLIHLSANFVKHEKETKTWNPVQDPNARPYFYGKLNNFYTLRLGLGRMKVITEKLRKSGVQVSYLWHTGASVGITKPVYLEIIYLSEPMRTPYLEIEKFDPNRHYIDNIYGRASGLRGMNELTVYPGAYAQFAFRFEYSTEKERLRGLEAGMTAEAFPTRIPIMSIDDESSNPQNHRLFLSMYVNFFIGTKYDQK
ncbi:MAG: hypothetical protein ACKO6L_01670 [Flavobacteriales bacterium]